MSELYGIAELPDGKFTPSLKIIDRYQRNTLPTGKLNSAEYQKGYFR